jgi:phage terminase large subunit-like protein
MTDPWSTALPDWRDRIRDGRSLVPDLPLHEAYAEKAVAIFKRLRAPDVIGQPRLGEICDTWVIDFVRALFGAYDPETAARAIQEFFLMVPKKNYKSGLASGVMLTAMILNNRPNAEMVLVSETQKISGIAFRNVRGMIQLDRTLADLFHVVDHQKKVVHLTTQAELQIVSADGDVVTGSKASCVLVDEAHVLGMKAKAPAVYLELRGGLASRPEGFFLQITTQSKVPPAGQFRKELAQARAVRDGKTQARVLSVLYEYPEDMIEAEAWRDEATWGIVNPNLEKSVSLSYLREQYDRAVEDGQEALNLFASQHLNVQVGQGVGSDAWSGALHWAACAQPGLTLQDVLDVSEVVTIGVDWGGADDLAALAVIGRRATDKVWLHWSRAWARPTVFAQRKAIAPLLRDFEAEGDLVVVETPEEQAAEAADICAMIAAAGLLPEQSGIGLDAAGVALLMDALSERDLEHPLVMAVPQGWKLQQAVSTLPLKLEARRVRHAGQGLMTWSVGNAKQELRGSNYMVTKQASGAAKIDPLVATFNAAMLMMLNPAAASPKSVPMIRFA